MYAQALVTLGNGVAEVQSNRSQRRTPLDAETGANLGVEIGVIKGIAGVHEYGAVEISLQVTLVLNARHQQIVAANDIAVCVGWAEAFVVVLSQASEPGSKSQARGLARTPVLSFAHWAITAA